MILVSGKPLRLHYLETKKLKELTREEADEASFLFTMYLKSWKKLYS